MSIISAGETPLLNVFKTGAVLVLISEASGQTLRIKENGDAEGIGGEGTLAQFTVHVRGPSKVALQNVDNPSYWLRIHNDDLNGMGSEGGKYTEFSLEENNNRIVLESVMSSGQHVGILENGEAKKPSETGKGRHAQFLPKVIHEVKEIITAGTSSEYESLLAHGNVVVLESVSSNNSLRVNDDGTIDGTGGNGDLAQFISHVVRDNVIKLQTIKNSERWLSISDDDKLTVSLGGKSSEFKVDENDGHLVLESVKFTGYHIGVLEDGDIKTPSETGKGKHGQFRVEVIKEQPEYHRAGTSLLERTLHHGNDIVLYSRASGNTLQINESKVIDGRGGEEPYAQFTVHVRAPGVVALQNKKDPSLYLRADPDQLTTAPGGSGCNFKVKDNGDYLLFEAKDYPGMHVGINSDGDAIPPNNTDEGENGQFTPKVKQDSPYSRPQ